MNEYMNNIKQERENINNILVYNNETAQINGYKGPQSINLQLRAEDILGFVNPEVNQEAFYMRRTPGRTGQGGGTGAGRKDGCDSPKNDRQGQRSGGSNQGGGNQGGGGGRNRR